MGIKELRENFHEKDADFSSHFHKIENGVKKPSWGKIIITWLVIIIALGIIFGAISGAMTGSTGVQYGSTDSSYQNTEPQLSEAEFKNASTTIAFKKLDKNPNSYAGEKVKYTGKVVQIMESGGVTEIRLATSGSYGDIIYVTYTGTTEALEDDTITIWGEVYGSYTYTSQANYEISLPRIDAKYIKIVSN